MKLLLSPIWPASPYALLNTLDGSVTPRFPKMALASETGLPIKNLYAGLSTVTPIPVLSTLESIQSTFSPLANMSAFSWPPGLTTASPSDVLKDELSPAIASTPTFNACAKAAIFAALLQDPPDAFPAAQPPKAETPILIAASPRPLTAPKFAYPPAAPAIAPVKAPLNAPVKLLVANAPPTKPPAAPANAPVATAPAVVKVVAVAAVPQVAPHPATQLVAAP